MRDLDFLTRLPVAHRGLHDAAHGIVENSPSAVLAALEGGYALEIDVQITADGEAVVFHDFTLDRLTTASGPVRAKTAAELKQVAFHGTTDRMMTLSEALSLVNGRATLLIEMKSAFDGDTRLARCCAALLSSYRGPVALMSFDPDLVVAVRRANPALVRGILAQRHYRADHWAELSPLARFALPGFLHWPRSRFQFLAYHVADLEGILPRTVRALGLPVLTWTVRTQDDRARAATHADQIIFEGFHP